MVRRFPLRRLPYLVIFKRAFRRNMACSCGFKVAIQVVEILQKKSLWDNGLRNSTTIKKMTSQYQHVGVLQSVLLLPLQPKKFRRLDLRRSSIYHESYSSRQHIFQRRRGYYPNTEKMRRRSYYPLGSVRRCLSTIISYTHIVYGQYIFQHRGRALFRPLNFQKCSEPVSFLHF